MVRPTLSPAAASASGKRREREPDTILWNGRGPGPGTLNPILAVGPRGDAVATLLLQLAVFLERTELV